MFTLHPQLEKDCTVIGQLPLSLLLLMNDANHPWLVLVPQRAAKREWYELELTEQHQLLTEINSLAQFLQAHTGAIKMNIGALGNMVPQLHVHVIARFEHDIAWPAPVWGKAPPAPYSDTSHASMTQFAQNFIAHFNQG
jgi:diadenosine tetraphosphate (Ap4A) HIT family hydrolase